MAVDVTLQRFAVQDEYFIRGGITVIGGNTDTTPPPIPRHWEIITVINLQDRNVIVTFDEPFENEPVGDIRVYRMEYKNGTWREQDVLFTYPNEVMVEKAGFEINIATFEELTGIIIKYMFSEGVIVEGGASPTIDLLTNLTALYDFANATAFTDEHGSNDGVVSSVTLITTGVVLSPAYSFNSVSSKVIVASTTPLLIDANTDSFSIELWFNSNGVDSAEGAEFNILTKNTSTGANTFKFATVGVLGTVRVSVSDDTNEPFVDFSNVWDDTWHHMVFVFDKVSNKLYGYNNGVKIFEATNTIAATTIAANTTMGINLVPESETSADKDIAISRLSIFKDKALTTDEITALYNLGNGLLYENFT